MKSKISALRACFSAFLVVFSLSVCAASFQGLSYSTSGDVKPGAWTSQYSAAKTYAEKNSLPLVVVWVSSGCGYCQGLAWNLGNSSSVTKWMKSRGFVFVFARDTKTADAQAAYNFAQYGSNFPFCRVYWKGKGVNKGFCGRSGSSAMSASKFMDVVDSATKTGKYAATYQLTIDKTEGCKSVSGAGLHRFGSKVTVKAAATSGYVFSGWYEGSALKTQAASYSFTMPEKALTVKAKFIRKADDSARISYTIKSQYIKKVAMEAVLVSSSGGSLPKVSFSGLPKGMKYSSGKVSGKPTKSGIYKVIGKNKTAGGALAAQTNSVVVRATSEAVVKVTSADATMGKVSGSGVYAAKKKVTVKAVPKKGFVFTGWYAGADLKSLSKSYKFLPPTGSDTVLVGKFATKADDLASLWLKVRDKVQIATALPTNSVTRGVQVKWPVAFGALSATKVSVSGLPAGLKLVKGTDGYAISGTPTTASSVIKGTDARKPSIAKIKVVSGGNTVTYRIAVIVDPLPAWACGSFYGVATQGASVGAANMTVSAKGAISGKYVEHGTNWAFKVTGYAEYKKDKPAMLSHSFTIRATAKYGKKLTRPLELTVTPGYDEAERLNFSCADGGDGVGTELELYRNPWADKGVAIGFATGTFKLEADLVGVSAKVTSAGKVTFTGKLAGKSVSASSYVKLLWDSDWGYYYVADLVIPTAKANPGIWERVEIPARAAPAGQ